MVGIHMAMTTVAARIYTVKEINTSLNTLQKCLPEYQPPSDTSACSAADAELPHPGSGTSPHGSHQLPGHNRITIQIHLCDRLCMLNTDILINSTLVDTKKEADPC